MGPLRTLASRGHRRYSHVRVRTSPPRPAPVVSLYAADPPARRPAGSSRVTRPFMASKREAIIIGAGHNGLVTACYLARGGWRVTVLERRSLVGGACVTEETF